MQAQLPLVRAAAYAGHMTDPNGNVAAGKILWAVASIMTGILLLDLMGVFIRMLSDTYPAEQLSFLRNLFGLVPSALVLVSLRSWHMQGRSMRVRQWPIIVVRGLAVTMAQLFFYLALTRLEFATASTLAFAGPLIVTALSVPVLGERVGPWRWVAVLIGFLGIVLIMRPGTDAFTPAALLPVGAAAGYATSSVLVRRIDRGVPTPLVNLYSTLVAMLGAAVLMGVLGRPVWFRSAEDLALIAAMGFAGGTGVLFLIVAYRMVPPSVMAPFEYSGILFAFGLGWVFFDEAPFERLFPGALLIGGAGLLIVLREHRATGIRPPIARGRSR